MTSPQSHTDPAAAGAATLSDADTALLEHTIYEVKRVIVGQDQLIERILVGLLARGHILLEGVPGVAKTLAVETFARVIGGSFSRVQFTPDLVPTDLIGTRIYRQGQEKFDTELGPVVANFLLADEINRAPAKVQSALLEAMQERQVTIGPQTYPLPQPFLVLATMNPIEQEGTYPLPEAQTDRFMLKVVLDYPRREEEKLIIRYNTRPGGMPEPQKVLRPEEIIAARQLVREVYMDEKIEQYIVDIVYATRKPDQYKLSDLTSMIGFGGSPRASINMALAAKAFAFTKRRGYVIPEDVRAVCPDVLRHRIGLTYEAEAENISVNDIIGRVLNTVEVP